MGSCSKRTSPSPTHRDRVEVAEHQPSASHYRRTHGPQVHLGLDPAELREEDRNHRTKRLRRQPASWDRRIASGEAEHKLAEGILVGDTEIPAVAGTVVGEGCKAQTERKESLAVVGMAFPAAKHTEVEETVRLAAEDTTIPAVAGTVVADSQAEEQHPRIRSGVVETEWAY